MKVLHLFSNSKWTGPAEPALSLCVALRKLGFDADFACAPIAGSGSNRVVEQARAWAIEPLLSLHLLKHRHPLYNRRDVRRLRSILQDQGYQALHCHLDNDHQIALQAVRGLGIPVLRSSYYGLGFPEKRRFGRLLAQTTLVLEPSQRALDHDHAFFKLPKEHAMVLPGAIDIERFSSERALPDMRAKLGIDPGALVIGIVARMQTHRRYEDLFHAFSQLQKEVPQAHLVVVGRGTKEDSVAFKPVTELGLSESVHFPGYLSEDEYVGMLNAFDLGVFLVPGSDGTCRAVREMMALGKPVIAANRGMLPEIVNHEENGLIFDNDAPALFQALARLATNATERAQFAAAAKTKAQSLFSPASQAKSVLNLYTRLLSHP